MDTQRVFNSDCMDYVKSSRAQSTIFQRIFITVKFLVIGVWSVFLSFVKKFFGLFKCRPEKDISGQVALVTGGGNGLGREIALRLAREKCHVAIADIDIDSAEKTVQEVRNLGVKAKAYKVDISNYDQLLVLKSEISSDLGRVSILVNNAALLCLFDSLEGSREHIQKSMNVNVCSHIWTTKIFIEDMVKQGRGHIVAICSLFGLLPGRCTIYPVTKNALHTFMSCLREEIIRKEWQNKVKTTSVYPIFIATREEITNVAKKDTIIVYSPSYVADVVVKAIKNEEEIVSIPNGYFTLLKILSIFPQEAVRNTYNIMFGKNNEIF